MARPFKSEKILEEKISEATLRAYHVGFDQNRFRLQPLVDIIRSVIPEFALGYIAGNAILGHEIIDRLKEAAETVYTTDKYKKRGEFGELILHLLLRDFCNTTPLVSKIQFKDSTNATVHGFDGVHITSSNGAHKLWLGESKLYINGEAGIRDLVKDLEEHIKADYLRKEFMLIKTKLPEKSPDIEYWRDLIDRHTKLQTIFSHICVPLVCTYSSDIFKNHRDETGKYLEDFKKECIDLHAKLEKLKAKIHTNVDAILMLLPVPDKDRLNEELDKRLKHMQKV